MAEELLVVLNRSENSGFGFSLLGKPGLPPIIYNILEDSPAAESGEVSHDVLMRKLRILQLSTGKGGAAEPTLPVFIHECRDVLSMFICSLKKTGFCFIGFDKRWL